VKKVLFIILVGILGAAMAVPETKAESARVTGVDFDAEFYAPQGTAKRLGVLVLGGSEGGIPGRRAKLIAENGFPALALGYFKTDRTPAYLDMIPLEYVDQPIEYLMGNKQVMSGGIVVVGESKGGELALLLASRKLEITGVVAFVPSSVVFQGVPKVYWPPRSSWSFDGKPVPFVPYAGDKGFDPSDLLGLYQRSLQQKEPVQNAVIPVERINGPLLLFSGADDRMWPSVGMCEMICQRLKENNFGKEYNHFKYNNAGHTLSEYFMIGGTKEGNKEARLNSTEKMLDFLNRLEAERAAPAGAGKPRR
jgi:uncharacterized protein